MTRPPPARVWRALPWSIVFLAIIACPRWAAANGGDLPPQITLQGFIKPEEGRVRLLVRVPLVLLSSFSLPKRGPGYLDLARIDDGLQQAAAATGRQIQLFADDVPLVPMVRSARISLLSDRSFSSYSAALAHFQDPSLPVATDLFWNQGFFDAQLEYPMQSPRSRLWIRTTVAPELEQRLKLRLEYLPASEPARTYDIPGASGWIPLDPRWYETAWLFAKGGFIDVFDSDRLVFLLCLIAPFRQFRSLLAIVMVLSALRALTLTAVAEGAFAHVDLRWLPALFATALGAAVVLLAIANLGAPRLRRRWLVGAVIGALGGFGLGNLLAEVWQFAGTHTLVSVVAFNLGVALGEVASLAMAFIALRLVFARVLGPLLGVIVLSAVLGHIGWHAMIDGGHELTHQLGHAGVAAMGSAWVVALWLLPALLAGASARFLPNHFDGAPVASLLDTLLGRSPAQGEARASEP